jgi:putative heme-binding domain-containing protein
MRRSLACCVIALLPLPALAQPTGLTVPIGFEVTEYADSKLANDIYCMTVDPQGRIVVAGRGYIRVLVDDDGDGKANRAIELAAEPKDGAMGLLFEGDTLYVTGDGGLQQFDVKDAKAIGPPQLIRKMKTGGEHTTHAIRRGPDGWLYVLCGNNAGIDRSFAQTPASPVKEPIAGCVLRFSPDLKQSEIVAHGFRNPYSMDFTLGGELVTFDSDNERCVSLPWYEPTRFYRVIAGGFYGWLNPQRASFWRMPRYFFDVVPPIATLGRGSPTGVVCYKHKQFPKAYRGGLFLCDWTFGRIYFAHAPESTLVRQRPSIFLSTTGASGFAPTGAVVHPETGDLFVCTGGRGTRGAVYRIRFPKGIEEAKAGGALKVPMRELDIIPYMAPSQRSLDVDLTGSAAVLKEAEQMIFAPKVKKELPEVVRLRGIRMLQRYLGDIGAPRHIGTIWEGYTPRKEGMTIPFAARLAAAFSMSDSDIDTELARTLAMQGYGDEKFREQVLAHLRKPTRGPIEDIHYLAVFARLPGERNAMATTTVAEAMLNLDRRIVERKLKRDTNWPLRVRELYAGLAEKDGKLHEAIIGHPQFGRPDHALFAQAPGFPRQRAAEVFLDRVQHDKDYALSAAVVEILGDLPAERVVPAMRKLWGQTGQDAAMLPLLARLPVAADRGKFIDGLASAQPATLRACVEALDQLKSKDDGREALGLLLALKRLPDNQKALRGDVLRRLQQLSVQKLDAGDPAWLAWFGKEYPRLAARLANPDGVDVGAWEKRFANLDWPAGSAASGQKVFQKASCASCHSGSQALGPDLTGVTNRFSRADLFTAIVQPSRDVPARYQATVVETADGKVYQGLVIYDAVDSLLLQTGPTAMVRLDGQAVVSRRVAAISPMPSGLLDTLSDQEVVDLYAYLRTLGQPGKQ